jgi:hypothetical protein
MSEPLYKLVDGELVQMTPEEQAAFEADAQKQRQAQTIASTTLDMGPTMFEILNGALNVSR